MKIPASVRRLYADQKSTNDRLKHVVDARINGFKAERWHYISRVKELQSFALKIESGRAHQPNALEDFFACTLVVANSTEIAAALALVEQQFDVKERRPREVGATHKLAESFPFDDLRLYVTLRSTPSEPPTDLAGIRFEIQIKTFLQHAWGIATHDLIYKAEDVSWSKERIAFQIKAMLEHAEVSIEVADGLANCSTLLKEDKKTKLLRQGMDLVKAEWPGDELPKNIRGLADNIVGLATALEIDLPRIGQILQAGRDASTSGAHPSNLSPYGTLIQYLFNLERQKMVKLLTDPRSKKRVLIPQEVELPVGTDRNALLNALFV